MTVSIKLDYNIYDTPITLMLLILSKKDVILSLLEKFPDHFTPREIQKEIISQIEEKLKSGFKKIILCAPTGVGNPLLVQPFQIILKVHSQ